MNIPIWARRSALAAGLMMAAGAAQAAEIDLTVNHNVSPAASGLAGGDFSYTPLVFLTNGGNASGVTLTQVLPEGIWLKNIETGGKASCNATGMPFLTTSSNNTITCALDPITANGSANGIPVEFKVTIPEVGTDWQALASAQPSSADTDSNTSDNLNLPRNITTNNAADLGIEITGPATATQFESFNYVAKVTNYGPTALPNGGKVTVVFDVPANTSVNNAGGGGSGWTCSPATASSGQIACTHAGPVARDAELNDLVIPVTSTATGDVTLTADVQGYGADGSTKFPDAVVSNNTSLATVTLGANTSVELSLDKKASQNYYDAKLTENLVTWTLTPKRLAGTAAASTVKVTDTLPSGVTFASFGTSTGWDCGEASNVITCDFNGTTPNAGSDYPKIEINTKVAGSTASPITNTGTVDYGSGTKTGTATITASNTVNLSLGKYRSHSPIKTGESFSWEIYVQNNGPLDVLSGQTITVVDNVPAGIKITSAAGPDWTCKDPFGNDISLSNPVNGGAAITCTHSAGLPADKTGDAHITSPIRLDAVGTFSTAGSTHTEITNKAAVTGVEGRDGTWPSDSSTVNVSEYKVDLNIAKAVDKTSVVTGEEVTYTITVTNPDTTNRSTGIVVTDTLTNLVKSQCHKVK